MHIVITRPKEDSSDLKGALKRMQEREYDEEIFEVEKEAQYQNQNGTTRMFIRRLQVILDCFN